jgi:hypothetical protein
MDTSLEVPVDVAKAERERMWGYISEYQGEGRVGWKVCQFVREGRVFYKDGEICEERAVAGEKYCEGHLPRTPNKIVWLLLGAAAMWVVMRLI